MNEFTTIEFVIGLTFTVITLVLWIIYTKEIDETDEEISSSIYSMIKRE